MKRTIALVACLAAPVVAGCGSSSKSSSSSNTTSSSAATPATTPAPATAMGGKGGKLTIAADPSGQLKFSKSSLTATAGTVTITMDNPSSIPHGVGVTGNGIDKDGAIVNKGGKSTVTATLKAGTYQYYCPVPGHKQAGMMGTLTVK